MAKTKKSWADKLNRSAPAKVEILPKAFGGMPKGGLRNKPVLSVNAPPSWRYRHSP